MRGRCDLDSTGPVVICQATILRPACAGPLHARTVRIVPLAMLLVAPPLSAQELRIHLRDEVTRAPLVGALVGAVQGTERTARRLSPETGRVVLSLPHPGIWRLRVDRIGFEAWESPPFEVAAGDVITREWLVPSLRRDLPTIVVVGETPCAQRMESGSTVASLWEEIRLALEASELTLREGNTPLHVREFTRELSDSLVIQRHWISRAAVEAGQPFRSLPPDHLAREGFVQHAGGRASFHGPDAALLLSDAFLETHCFETRPGSDGLVGLAFSPVPSRTVPEIEGTLWIDRTTSELRTLEFRYINLSPPLDLAGSGGRVEYQRLEDGGWIIRDWHIRMPRLAREQVDTLGRRNVLVRQVGFLDQGGTAVITDDPAGVVTHATLEGQVIDSTTGAGLGGVLIELHDERGEPEITETDSSGRFSFTTLRSGDQLVVARHPKLGVVGRSATRSVLLSIGDTARVEFGVVPMEAMVRWVCGNTRDRSGVVGMALGDFDVPVMDLAFRATWRTPAGRTREARGRLMPDGLFGVCDLPVDLPIRIEARVRQQVLSTVEVELEPREFRWVELRARRGG